MVGVLALAACAVPAGATSPLTVGEWITDAPPHVLEQVGVRLDPPVPPMVPACGNDSPTTTPKPWTTTSSAVSTYTAHATSLVSLTSVPACARTTPPLTPSSIASSVIGWTESGPSNGWYIRLNKPCSPGCP
nr:transposase family protein [Streptomyces sp. SID12501]